MELEYSPIPERAVRRLEGFPTAHRQDIEDDVNRFRYVTSRRADNDGEVEVLHGVEMTHHFVQAPGESETIGWHYVGAGKGEPVVLLLASWYPRLLVFVASSDRRTFQDSPRNCSRPERIWSVREAARRLPPRRGCSTTSCST